MCGLLYSILHPPTTFLANWVLDTYGFRKGIVCGAICMIIGVLLKLLINTSFAFVLLGSSMAAIGHVFILNAPMKLAINWFRDDKVSPVNTFCVLALMTSSKKYLSDAIGSIIPVFFVG